ncbi:MAG: RdgB/HAM1 family non-canonical purine NTP pyrophosphatase [Bacteroidaceae bacterium]|nr:RdgB/HAM1 family non-canonical purine NTP pyrophosphatase [Bacteroidaceae bacterium]
MTTLVFASNNAHKLDEIRSILGDKFIIKSLKEIGCEVDIPETADTFRGNALQKAQYIKEHFGYDCFADDSGLQVECLDNLPGVFSARFADKYSKKFGVDPAKLGDDKDTRNTACLLHRLNAIGAFDEGKHPKACFRTSIALIYDGKEQFFDGIVEGYIISEKRGNGGFGYDPVFVPEGYDKTFAELGNDIKNSISHRARAVAKLAEFLKK